MTRDSTKLADLGGTSTLTTRMHELLEEAIISGALEPGQRIHADALAAEYGMSRIPVREALRSLDQAGWVDIKPRHGVHVREHSPTELAELFEFRAVIESVVATWAAQRRTDQDLVRLERIVAQDSNESDAGVAQASSEFYAALRDAAHNSVLAHTSAVLEKRARFYFSTVLPQLGHDWLEVHQELARLIAAGDAASAGRLAQSHIESTGRAVHDLLFP